MQSSWKASHFIECSFLLLLLLSLTKLRFPEELMRNTLLAVRIYPNRKPSGKQVVLLLHITRGQKWNPRTGTKLGKRRCKLSPLFLSVKIIMARKTHYYSLNHHCRLMEYIFVFFYFQIAFWINHSLLFLRFFFCCIC